MITKEVRDGVLIERELTQEEIESMQEQNNQVQEISLEDRISAMEELLLDLL